MSDRRRKRPAFRRGPARRCSQRQDQNLAQAVEALKRTVKESMGSFEKTVKDQKTALTDEVKKILTIDEALSLYDKKFKALTQNKFHIIKSLGYFEDAEKDLMPQMVKKIDWQRVKEFFIEEQKALTKKLLRA